MPPPSTFFTGGATLFLALTLAQTYFAQSPLQGIYRRYALFLLAILCYFGIQPYSDTLLAQQGESVLFSAAAIGYLLFVSALFKGRASFPFIRDMVQMGIFSILACLAIEKALHVLAMWMPVIGWYIKGVDSLLRGFLAVLGLFFAARIYLRFPQDRFFSSFLLMGNASLLLGGLVAIVVALVPEATDWGSEELHQWSKHHRMFIVQLSLFPEIISCSLAIVRRQAGDAPAASPPPATASMEASVATEQEEAPLGAQEVPAPASQEKIAFRTGNGFELMKRSDIILIQGGGDSANFLKVFKEGQASPIIVTKTTLGNTLKLLSVDSASFLQPHKSYVVNVQKICRLYRDEDGVMTVVMDNGQSVPVSKKLLPILKARLGLE